MDNVIQSGCRLSEIHPIPPNPHDHFALPSLEKMECKVTVIDQAVASSRYILFHLIIMIILLYLSQKDRM
jgi:hypothetical protein